MCIFRSAQILLLLFVLSLQTSAQYCSVELSEENIKTLAESSKTATLFVVINNEKDPGDAALVNAVKNYWKIGPYKFMSKTEFVEQKMRGALSMNQFYLYEWYTGYNISSNNALEMTSFLNQFNTGYFVLSLAVPYKPEKKSKIKSDRTTDLLDLKFDLSSTIKSNKDKVLDGYFDLMVKYFSNEISFCQNNKIPLKDIKKENKDGIVYFGDGLQDVQSRDILLVKEQVNKVRSNDKKDNKRIAAVDAVAQFSPPGKNVYTVYPDDIKMALSKADKKVLLYTNDMLISASDGAVIAAPQNFGGEPVKKDYGFWLSALGILGLAFALGTAVK